MKLDIRPVHLCSLLLSASLCAYGHESDPAPGVGDTGYQERGESSALGSEVRIPIQEDEMAAGKGGAATVRGRACPERTWYPDVDGDGFGGATAALSGPCRAPEGYVANNKDCDDHAQGNPAEIWYECDDAFERPIAACQPEAHWVRDLAQCYECGNGTCENGETLESCEADCGNLLVNSSFEQSELWDCSPKNRIPCWFIGVDRETINVTDTDGDRGRVLVVGPGFRKSALQTVIFDRPTMSPFLISYRVKVVPENASASSKVAMVARFYVKTTGEKGNRKRVPPAHLERPLRPTAHENDRWVTKRMVFVPQRPVARVTASLYSSPEATTYYDDIVIRPLAPGKRLRISNAVTTMTLNTNGYVESLRSSTASGELAELLAPRLHASGGDMGAPPLSVLRLDNVTAPGSTRLTPIGNDEYLLDYGQTAVRVRLRIEPREDYFVFETVDVSGAEAVQELTLFNLHARNVAQSRDQAQKQWAIGADEDAIFIHSLPLNPKTPCNVSGRYYVCSAHSAMGLVGAKGALLTAPKSSYFDSMDHMIRREGLPRPMWNGVWIRRPEAHRKGYLFARVNRDNYHTVRKYALESGFEQVLSTWHRLGPPSFDTQEDAFTAFEEIRSGTNIEFGLHGKFGRAGFKSPEFALENLYAEPIGTVTKDWEGIVDGQTARTIQLEAHPGIDFFDKNGAMRRYAARVEYSAGASGKDGLHFLIGSEDTGLDLLRCELGIESPELVNCVAALDGAPVRVHQQGEEVSIVAGSRKRFWLNQRGMKQQAARLRQDAGRLGFTMLYADGGRHPGTLTMHAPDPLPGWYGFNTNAAAAYAFRESLLPLVEACDTTPMVQMATRQGLYGDYYRSRVTVWDGPHLKVKEMTRNHRVAKIRDDNPYGQVLNEMGWWTQTGANLYWLSKNRVSGLYPDRRAAGHDVLHYAMTKVVALDRSMGLQIVDPDQALLENHEIASSASIIGRYHDLVASDRAEGVIPESFKTYYAEPDHEAELSPFHSANYHFVEKRILRGHAVWNSRAEGEENAAVELNNPFEAARLEVEIQADLQFEDDDLLTVDPKDRPKGKLLGTPHHIELADFRSKNYHAEPTSAEVSCDLNGGVLTISNDCTEGDCLERATGCWIGLNRASWGTELDLVQHRGLRLGVRGHGGDELMVVRVHHDNQHGFRDFKRTIDFTGKRTMVLSDPTVEMIDTAHGKPVSWRMPRRLIHQYGRLVGLAHRGMMYYWGKSGHRVSIFVFAGPTGTQHVVEFGSLVALQERVSDGRLANEITNPWFSIGGTKVILPVTLKLSPYEDERCQNEGGGSILRFNLLTGRYRVLSSKLTPCGEPAVLEGFEPLVLEKGMVDVAVGSADDHEVRADVRLSLFDDPDGDGVPTHGCPWNETDCQPCGDDSSFCSDNCPFESNEDQVDSNSDGVGDACSSK